MPFRNDGVMDAGLDDGDRAKTRIRTRVRRWPNDDFRVMTERGVEQHKKDYGRTRDKRPDKVFISRESYDGLRSERWYGEDPGSIRGKMWRFYYRGDVIRTRPIGKYDRWKLTDLVTDCAGMIRIVTRSPTKEEIRKWKGKGL